MSEQSKSSATHRGFPLLRYYLWVGLPALLGVALLISFLTAHTAELALLKRSELYSISVANQLIEEIRHHFGLDCFRGIHSDPCATQNSLQDWLSANPRSNEIVKINFIDRTSTVWMSTNPSQVGIAHEGNIKLITALSGTGISKLAHTRGTDSSKGRHRTDLLETYQPIRDPAASNKVIGAIAIYQDITPSYAQVASASRTVTLYSVGALALLFLVLLGFVWKGDRIIRTQTNNLKLRTEELNGAHDQLKSTQKKLVITERMSTVGTLASGIAHEFNNILSAMKGHAQLAQSDPTHIDKFMEIVTKQTDRAICITQGLLTFSKSKANTVTHYDLNDLVRDVLVLAGKDLEQAGIQVCCTLCENPPKVPMVVAQIQQVLLNLIVNARHAVARQGTLLMTTRNDGQTVRVEVADDGAGISEEHLTRIFDPFFSARGTQSGGEGEGHGLGLSVSYNIVKNHGGSISVQSQVGVGTRFVVALPVQNSFSEEITDAVTETTALKESTETPVHGGSILIIDDEESIRSLIYSIVEPYVDNAEEASTGREAIALLERRAYDTVFLELMMPGAIGGLDLLEQIKQRYPTTRVVVISGKILAEGEKERILQNADAMIPKPFDPDQVRSLLY